MVDFTVPADMQSDRRLKSVNPTFAGFQNGARVPGMGHYDPSLISCKNEATEEY